MLQLDNSHLDIFSEAQRREGTYLRSHSELAAELGLRPHSLYSSGNHEASFGCIIKHLASLWPTPQTTVAWLPSFIWLLFLFFTSLVPECWSVRLGRKSGLYKCMCFIGDFQRGHFGALEVFSSCPGGPLCISVNGSQGNRALRCQPPSRTPQEVLFPFVLYGPILPLDLSDFVLKKFWKQYFRNTFGSLLPSLNIPIKQYFCGFVSIFIFTLLFTMIKGRLAHVGVVNSMLIIPN